MNAYLYTAISTVSQLRPDRSSRGTGETFQTWDGCSTVVIIAGNPEDAQRQFEAGLHRQPEGEHPVKVEVKKIVAAQFVDQLLTESGNKPLDWPALVQQNLMLLESATLDDFEQGYWVDVEAAIRPRGLSADIETLQRELPEDIRDGLNWSADKQFLYLLSVLSPPAPQPEIPDVSENENAGHGDSADDSQELQQLLETYPQGADKDAAAVIQARNSVVAAWLWRRFAADTPLATNRIRIDSWCEVAGLESGSN